MSATYHSTLAPVPSGRNFRAAIARFISAWWRGYLVWRNQQLAIAALRQLDNRLLQDIGIDRSEIGPAVRNGGKKKPRKFDGQRNMLKWL